VGFFLAWGRGPVKSFSSAQPKVSIVTPSYNMARFLAETIESVLSQDYPNIEYLVMDGGSRDGTVELLKSYGDRVRWVSEPDNGQSDAVNKGYQRMNGEIFTFLNADDTFLPGAVSAAVDAFLKEPHMAVVYGDAWYTDEENRIIRAYPVDPYDYQRLGTLCHICQPAAFIRGDVFGEVGMLDASLHLTLDYDLWLRISEKYEMRKIDRPLANSRMWADNKTLSRRRTTFEEVVQILKRHRGYVPLNWVYGYAGYLRDGSDGFYQVSPASLVTAAKAFRMGMHYNPRQPLRFVGECFAHAGQACRLLYDRYWKR
jgi:glycosyltransferase involved in cell wall biosynthesis